MNVNGIIYEVMFPLFLVSLFLGVVMPIYLYNKQRRELVRSHERQQQLMQSLRDKLHGMISYSLSVEVIKINDAQEEAKESLQSYKDELFEEYTYYEKLHLGIMYLNKGQHTKAARQFLLSCNGWYVNGDIINTIFSLNLLSLILDKISGSGFRFLEKSLDKEDVCMDSIFTFLLKDKLSKNDAKIVAMLKQKVEDKRNEVFTA